MFYAPRDRQKRINVAPPQQQDPHLRSNLQRRDVMNALSDAELIKRNRLNGEDILCVSNLVRGISLVAQEGDAHSPRR